jgi:hypothetical protein
MKSFENAIVNRKSRNFAVAMHFKMELVPDAAGVTLDVTTKSVFVSLFTSTVPFHLKGNLEPAKQ